MAAFQITITPPVKKAVKTEKFVEYVTPKLILSPFNPTPEIVFGSVTVNAKVTKPLIIFNPNPQSITVQLKNIDSEDRISVSDHSIQLNSREEKEIYVSWSPLQSGYLRKVIRVQDACRKARSFDVILNGTCVNNKANDRRKRLKGENKQRIGISSQRKNDGNVPSYKIVDAEIRRQTYRIEEKENCIPKEMLNDGSVVFCTSSPKYSSSNLTTYFNDDLRLFDHTDSCTKYSNFESELKFNADISSLHSSDGLESYRRGSYTLNSGEVAKNPFSLSSVDELDGSPSINTNIDPNYCEENDNISNQKNITFDANTTPENVRLTPIKSLSCLLTPTAEFPEFFETPRASAYQNQTCNLSDDSLSSTSRKKDLIFISPPTKTKFFKKSPECTIVRRHVSSAISDRKKHLKTNILPRRKTPPSALKINKIIPSVEKMKTQDPSTLKQVLRSHINDPFLKQSLYCDENWIDRQEKDIIKWMNSILTSPMEFNEEIEGNVDAAAVWLQSCRDTDLRRVPSISNIAAAIYYHSPQRLDTVRKAASSFLTCKPIHDVFLNITRVTQKKIISVREDRDLHLDQGLKNKLLQLLSCYNPLWLQIALEAIYKQKITRQGKNDVGGLGWFIRKHVLTSSISNKKNAHPAVLQMTKPNFKDQVKKYILEKFLCLIYFLDQAKMRKLIRHNPCLFVFTSEYKSSQDLLMAFCGDLVVGRGDIIKHLKAIDYVLQYKQTCIDEYDYKITSLHDLKDGVRLARLFEILFNESDLCSKLRVPAISILQKIYNVAVAMKAAESKCTIEGDITAKEIVSGHREKILSFLWQIINNYLTPLYEKSAITVQRWWRKVVWPKILLMKQQEQKLHSNASIIQAAWRGYVSRKNTASMYAELREQNAKLRNAAVVLQRRFRATREMRKQRKIYETTIYACVKLQTWWRCKLQRRKFLSMKSKIVSIQRRYRANNEMKHHRKTFLLKRNSAIVIQRRFRANCMMKIQRQNFTNLKKSAIFVQTRFRANLIAKTERLKYLTLKTATVCIQTKFKAIYQMKQTRLLYQKLKTSAVFIQRKYRALKAMKQEQSRFNELKSATICIQRRFRTKKVMMKQRENYVALKSATVCLQRRFRAIKLGKRQRDEYLELKMAVVFIQQQFRANRSMKRDRLAYQKLKYCCISIQTKFRSKQKMKSERREYLELKTAAINVQRLFRMKRQLKLDRSRFEKIKRSVVIIQRQFRAYQLAKRDRESYLKFRQSVIQIQRRYRSMRLMKQQRNYYMSLKYHVIQIQALFRAQRATKMDRRRYLELTNAVLITQRRYRANRLMKLNLEQYLKVKCTVVTIQRKFRANLLMKTERTRFLKLKKTCVVTQQKFRANAAMKIQRDAYVRLKNNVIFIQRKFRANRAMRIERNGYQELRTAVVNTQRRYRATLLMRTERNNFIRLKNTVEFVQKVFKSKLLAQKERRRFLSLKSAALTVQKIFKANRQAKMQRRHFETTKLAAITIQRKFRAYNATRIARNEFLRITSATRIIQNWYRARISRRKFLIKRNAAITIQRKFRAWKEIRSSRVSFLKLKYVVSVVQSRRWIFKQTNQLLDKFIGSDDMKFDNFTLENMTVCSPEWIRNLINSLRIAEQDRMAFISLKITTIFIQRHFRKKLQVRAERTRMQVKAAEITALKETAATKIQARWRGYQVRKKMNHKYSPAVNSRKQNPNLDTKVTLEERCVKAIKHLKESDMYDVITHALWNLESVTMLSAKLCEGVAAENIIPIIFNLMARGNRSEPSLEIYRSSCSILVNLAKHRPTKIILWETINKVDDIYLILHIMKITHDKTQVPVFRCAATLLWLLCQDDSAAQIVGSLYSFRQQIEKMLEKLKRMKFKNPQTKKTVKMLPKLEADWFPDPQHRIFENNYVAIINVHRILYSR